MTTTPNDNHDDALARAGQNDTFWSLYAERVQPAVERACRAASRARTDNGMPAEDMVAWVDEKVWSMLASGQEPFFAEGLSAEESADRLERGAGLLARWAYLALSRSYWRRKNRERRYAESLGAPAAGESPARTPGRAERLAGVSREEAPFEASERIASDLSRLRQVLDEKTKARLAATWLDRGETKRVAMALGATDDEAESIIEDVAEGRVKQNTVDQWRSRSRSRAVEAAAAAEEASRRSGDARGTHGRGGSVLRPVLLMVAFVAAVLASASVARAEQTGGRGSGNGMSAPAVADGAWIASVGPSSDEQTGGRGGRDG